MKGVLISIAFLSLSLHGDALKCYTCVASNEEECDSQGSQVCPQHADGCSTITGPDSVMRSCSYMSFCERAHHATGKVSMDCCFTDECNGPPKGRSAITSGAIGKSVLSSPYSLTLSVLMARCLFGRP